MMPLTEMRKAARVFARSTYFGAVARARLEKNAWVSVIDSAPGYHQVPSTRANAVLITVQMEEAQMFLGLPVGKGLTKEQEKMVAQMAQHRLKAQLPAGLGDVTFSGFVNRERRQLTMVVAPKNGVPVNRLYEKVEGAFYDGIAHGKFGLPTRREALVDGLVHRIAQHYALCAF